MLEKLYNIFLNNLKITMKFTKSLEMQEDKNTI